MSVPSARSLARLGGHRYLDQQRGGGYAHRPGGVLALRPKAQRTSGGGRDRDRLDLTSGRGSHESSRRRRHTEHGMGPSGNRHGGRKRPALRGFQGGRHGFLEKLGADSRARSARQLFSARLDPDRMGAFGVSSLATASGRGNAP